MSGALNLAIYNLLVNDGSVKTLTPAELTKLDGLTPSTAELNFVKDVTSAIQTQLNAITTLLGSLSASELGILDDYILPPVHFHPDFDAIMSYIYSSAALKFISGDANAGGFWSFLLPKGWDTTVTLVMRYVNSTTNTWSGKWDVQGMAVGQSAQTEVGNILNDDTSNDFPSGTANIIYEKTIALDNANVVGGNLLTVFLQSDNADTGHLYIISMGVRKT